jgi:hypothetical protein
MRYRAQYGGHRGGGKSAQAAARVAAFDDGAPDKRAVAIDEAARALPSDIVSVLMLPARQSGAAGRHLQVAFQYSDAALLSIAGARMLHRQLGHLLAIVDGRPPE